MYQPLPDESLSLAPVWLRWLESCSSTNTWAIAHTHELHHGDIVFTRQQTNGKGQHGRVWHSPPGVLTASFIGGGRSADGKPYPLSVAHLTGLSLVAGLAVIYAVEDLLPQLEGKLRLKWANDVWLQNDQANPQSYGKLAGILCEAVSQPSAQQTRVVIGVGLNRAVDFAAAGLGRDRVGYPVSLHQVCATVPDEIALLERLRHYFLQTLDILGAAGAIATSGFAAFLPELQRRDGLLNRQITLKLGDREISGQAVGVDSSGRLLMQLPEGIQSFASGRVLRWE